MRVKGSSVSNVSLDPPREAVGFDPPLEVDP